MSKTELSYYTEYTIDLINDLKCFEGFIFTYEEQLSFSKTYLELSEYFNSHGSSSFSPSLIKEYSSKILKSEFNILLIEEYDDGSYSPFVTKTYHLNTINSQSGNKQTIGVGSCHYNDQTSFYDMLMFAAKVFCLAFALQPILRLLTVISIPETCINTMSYMLCPIAFVLGALLPYLIAKICMFCGVALPDPESDFNKSLHWLLIIFLLIRYTPSVLLSTLCYRLNIYEEYVKEKWFLCLTILGGALGNLVWIITGTTVNLSYMLNYGNICIYKMIEIVISFGIIKGPDSPQVDPETGERIVSTDLFTEELNPYVRYDTNEIFLLGLLFVLLAMVSSFYQSDVLCGRASIFTSAGSIAMIVSCNLCYAGLLLSFSSFKLNLSHYLSFGYILFVCAFLARTTKFGKSGRKVDHTLEAPEEEVIVDAEAKKFLLNKNRKGMVTKLGKCINSNIFYSEQIWYTIRWNTQNYST